MSSIALFDFDGTLTKKDAFLYFIAFAVGKTRLLIGAIILSPVIFLYLAKIISNEKAKQIVFSWFFSGWSQEEFEAKCNSFCLEVIPEILNEEAVRKMRWHQSLNHKVVVVSANFDCLLNTWCEQQKVGFICTCLEFKNGKVTGKFTSKNCYGEEKVNRLKQQFLFHEYEHIYAYGDSKGDIPMLKLASYPFYKKFN